MFRICEESDKWVDDLMYATISKRLDVTVFEVFKILQWTEYHDQFHRIGPFQRALEI